MATRGSANVDEPLTEQLNVKFDQDILDELKARANELRRPYHRLAREWVEASLAIEEERLGLEPSRLQLPAIKDLMVLLLHAPSRSGEDAVRGVTRLQKLLFVLEQKLASQSTRFYAYNFGPFSEEVNDAADALQLGGVPTRRPSRHGGAPRALQRWHPQLSNGPGPGTNLRPRSSLSTSRAMRQLSTSGSRVPLTSSSTSTCVPSGPNGTPLSSSSVSTKSSQSTPRNR